MNDYHNHTLIGGLVVVRRYVPMFMVLCLSVLMTACGSKGVVQTSDNSADYRSAKSLPPLKKPSRPASETPPVASQELDPQPSIADAADDQSKPVTPLEAQIPEARTEAQDASLSLRTELSARVIEVDDVWSRLEISGEYDEAWRYLTATLKSSDVTVFSRNRTAGRFAIGCAGVAKDAIETERKGGWLFFKRDKNQGSEYCSLKVDQKRDVTQVSVLDRAGIEVAGENSADLFARILNN